MVDEEKIKAIKAVIRKYASTLPETEAANIKSLTNDVDALAKGGKPKRTSERSTYMGACMRKPEKGGRGLGMAECSLEWKKKKELTEVKK